MTILKDVLYDPDPADGQSSGGDSGSGNDAAANSGSTDSTNPTEDDSSSTPN
jgi:hypothetical protein